MKSLRAKTLEACPGGISGRPSLNHSKLRRAMKQVRVSPRAKRVLGPWFVIGLGLLVAFITHMVAHGGAAFPGGKVVGGRYLVEEHGKLIEFTRESFRLSYLLGIASTVAIASFLLAVLAFYWSGDLKDEARGS